MQTEKIINLLNEKGYLLADGATGTNLFDMGLESGYPPELWNDEKPELVSSNHKNFIEAGSDIILTNSFGANKHRLALHNCEHRVKEINIAAARIARENADSSGRTVLVAGSIGPTGEILQPIGPLAIQDAVSAFTDQAMALKKGGCDMLWIETMSSVEEMDAAIKASQKTDLPTICTFSFDTHGKSMMGLEPKELSMLANKNKDAVIGYGANCGIGASELIGSMMCFNQSKINDDQLIVAKANCGIPEFKGTEIRYSGTSELMAKYALYARSLGAKIIGGCCGTTHVHVKAMSEALSSNSENMNFELNKVIEGLGEMTKGNIQMINNYLNPNTTPEKPERKRRRRRSGA